MTCSAQAIDIKSQATEAVPTTRLGHLLKRGWEAYWERQAKRTTVYMLRSLDDHTLHDIGFGRSEIESVVYGSQDERRRHYEHTWE